MSKILIGANSRLLRFEEHLCFGLSQWLSAAGPTLLEETSGPAPRQTLNYVFVCLNL